MPRPRKTGPRRRGNIKAWITSVGGIENAVGKASFMPDSIPADLLPQIVEELRPYLKPWAIRLAERQIVENTRLANGSSVKPL